MMMRWNIYCNSSIQNMMKTFWILNYRCSRLYWWSPLLQKIYTVSIVLFHKYGGANVSVTNSMSKISIFVPTKDTVKLDNENKGHAQGIGIILCLFSNCSIIYPVGTVYYCTGHPFNTISSGFLKFYAVFQKVTSEPLEHCDFVDFQGCS